MKLMARGTPHENAFDDPVNNIKMPAHLWAGADTKFIEDSKAANTAVFAATQQRTDRYPSSSFAVFLRLPVMEFREKSTMHPQHVNALENLCINGRGIAEDDREELRRLAADAREKETVMNESAEALIAELSKQQ